MCFSTEASFAAAVFLGVAGGVTLKIASRPLLLLAAIPLLFALQQLSEGILWLQISHQLAPSSIYTLAMHAFLFFAFFVWPIWVPLALGRAERISWRRNLIFLDLAAGTLLSLMNLYYALEQPISIALINHSIQYIGNVPPQGFIYPLIILLPCFISSLKHVNVYGLLIAIGYGVAWYLYANTFVSVWCFFAALTSVMIYKVIKDNQEMVESRVRSSG